MFRAILIVGATNSGKTTFGKKILKKWWGKKYIFDVNNEHKGGVIMDSSTFLQRATQLQETLIYFEESTIFFSNKGDSKLLKMLLVKKRHDKNIIIMVFHSIQSIPLYVLTLCDVLILFKTIDNEKLIFSKYENFPGIMKAFKKQQAKKELYSPEIVLLNPSMVT